MYISSTLLIIFFVCVLVRQPSGHSVSHPETYSSVFGPAQPHGTDSALCTMHVGTGHRTTGQSAGRVVRVTVGQAAGVALLVLVLVLVLRGGSVTTLVTTTGFELVLLVVEVVELVVLLVVRGGGGGGLQVGRLRLDVEVDDDVVVVEEVVDVGVTGHGRARVRNCTAQPLYGQSPPHGAMSVAVGTAAGQPQAFWIVEMKVQSALAQAVLHPGASCVLVTVGHAASAASEAVTSSAASVDPASRRSARARDMASAKNFMAL
ncbi:hypothetical protein NKR23_g1557 [Pleurostoma richardsiae]|uniref:Secreted protein n=1 Tax=Pleurostoma richardsiae TaxID=41990 RepID=A0AA38SBJ1_9PEZI|nr:hypothetical protein NKR23_g1557 [Pleurostoma richardsiae]